MNPRSEGAQAPFAKTSAEIFERAFYHGPTLQSIVRLPEGVLVDVNESFLQATGFRREEVIGKTPLDLGFWVFPERILFYREQLLKHGRVRDFEAEVRAKDGSIRTVLLCSEVVAIDGIPHSLSSGVDITLRKQAEAELRVTADRLRQSEERFSKAFRANPAIVALTRFADGKFVSVNEAFLRALGYTEAEVIGRTATELALHVPSEQQTNFMERVGKQGSIREVEFVVRSKQGDVRTLLASGELTDIDGTTHLLTVGLDITERKLAEAELQNALVKAQDLNQLKTDFVSLVSHEFRTPLEIIMSSADNLDRYHERLPAEKRAELLRTINKSVRRMSSMMEEVLVLGRLEKESITFCPTMFDFPGFCWRICDEIESAMGKSGVIRRQFDPAVGQAMGDESVLRHILTNLLSNALKYSPDGAPVDFTVERAGEIAVFRVADRGCGIPEADQKRLFQAFHRGSNVRQIPGTGLGLLIVRRCVDLHRGEIAFESTEGRGTTFTVRLLLFPTPVSNL